MIDPIVTMMFLALVIPVVQKFDRREVGKRRCEIGRERVSVAGGLGATPIGHSVEQVDDPVAKLQDADG